MKNVITGVIVIFFILSVLLMTDTTVLADSVVYTDSFQDGEMTSPMWTASGGSWSVITDTALSTNQVLLQNDTLKEAYITAGEDSWTNYTFQMRLRHVDGGAFAGILARYTNSDNYYMFRMNPVGSNTLELYKKVNGTFTTLGTKTDYALSTNTWYTLKILVTGSVIKCYINNVLIFDVVDSSLSNGKIGIRSRWGSINADDATVTSIATTMGISAISFLLKDTTSVNNAKVEWSAITGATNYVIYRSINNGSYQAIQTVTGNSIDDYGLIEGSSYKYQVEAYSGNIMIASAVSPSIVPYALPDNLTTFDNTQTSALETPNTLKIGDTYYRFVVQNKTAGGFGYLVQQTSTDDINYGNDLVVLSYTDHPDLADCKFEGGGVIYNASTNKFIWWAHYENTTDYTLARVSVASGTPGQSFTFHKSFRPMDNDSHDMAVFVDDDGLAYLISSANNNSDTILYKLTSDWLDVESLVCVVYDGLGRELPSMIKRDGYYYLFSSQAAGWYPSKGMYSSATSLSGPWSDLREIGNTSTFSAQSGGVVRLKEKTGSNFVMVAYRWMFGWAGVEDGVTQQRLLPIAFSSGYAFYDYFDQVLYNAENDIVVPVQNGKLLSQGKTATAQTALESNPAGYANDGNYYTEWVATSVSWPHEWTVDLGSVQKISNVQISWWMYKGSEAFYQYTIETSTDNVQWDTVDCLDNTDYGFTSDTFTSYGRYVRINLIFADLMNNTSNWYTPRLMEVKIFGDNSIG